VTSQVKTDPLLGMISSGEFEPYIRVHSRGWG
jgi:hypothetical protein